MIEETTEELTPEQIAAQIGGRFVDEPSPARADEAEPLGDGDPANGG